MGTRNVTAVFHEGRCKLAQYGQWDGYPRGQGLTALEFCREHLASPAGVAAFVEQLKRVRFPDVAEVKRLVVEAIGSDPGQWWNMEQSKKFHDANPFFSRDHGAKILELVLKAEREVLTNNGIDFCADSLMCEWAWVIDLDAGTFEAFEGHNKTPLDPSERFAAMPGRDGYTPVRCVAKWKLNDLPSNDSFLTRLGC